MKLEKSIDYSCMHHVWRRYSNITISCKQVHSTLKTTVSSQHVLTSWARLFKTPISAYPRLNMLIHD